MRLDRKKEADRQYYIKNRDKILARNAEFRRNNPELKKERDRQDREKHLEKRKAHAKEYHEKNKEVIKEAKRRDRINNPDKYQIRYMNRKKKNPLNLVLIGLKARAKKKGLECNIELADFELITHCPVLGFELDYFNEKQLYNSPSFDRIDPNKGYIKGNVRIISWRANNLKSNGTIEEFEQIIRYMKEHL